ncbi:uncharacterized protein KIAA2012 homolog isoform X2 [Acanthaster planci]|uniref:Uncharacterized protein KIAA2012 homolog isoform X2 n=1 Tax=Acanthaster planci TaxID=133434 RepID=A0A8B7ZY15_ACAPL|nr:uncharacterized protein KIAA2012 homolog isoform X2 [Acanthaster planci]
MATVNTGFSLLARGIGEEKVHRGHRKLEVSLEPEDYHNIQGRKFYLPPIQQRAWPQEELDSPRELHTHKTFTTRKGALLLYSEDLALTAKERAESNKALEAEDTLNLNTFHDLRSAILSYGAKDASSEPVYLGFVHNKHAPTTHRAVRPGFSAKRYLSNWSRSWDDSILNTLRNNGHILDKNLFQENALAPKILRRINDDLSGLPAPYRVTRNMLMAPGSPIIYEFYRVRPSSADSGRPSEDDFDTDREGRRTPMVSFNIPGSIAAVVRDEQNKPHAVPYSSLAPDEQQQVLQRLLLQSAMHKQLLEAAERTGQELGSNTSLAGSRPVTVEKIKKLNMGNAIATLVDTNTSGLLQGQQVFDDKGFKELYKRKFGQQAEPSPPTIRKGLTHSARRSHFPSVPTLPPIVSSSPTFKPAERQTLKLDSKLPQITMEPPTPQHPVLSNNTQSQQNSSWGQESEDFRESWPSDETNIWKADIDEEELLKQQQAASEEEGDEEDDREEELHRSETKTKSARSTRSLGQGRTPSKPASILSSVSVSMEDLTGPIISGASKHQSSSEKSYGGSSSEAGRSIKGSQLPGSLRESMRSYKGGRNSNMGSVVLGPDGEILSIGGGVGMGSVADAGSSVADATDNLQASSMAHSTHMGELESLDELDEQEDDTLSQDSGHMSSEEVEGHDPTPVPQPVPIPTAQFGDDLPESKPPSLPSLPLSKPTRSQKSAEESVHLAREIDITGGDLDATRSFANFSYGSVGQESVAEDALSQDGIDDHGEREAAADDDIMSEQEPDWPTEFGETSELAEEDALMEEPEKEVVNEEEKEPSTTGSVKDEVASQRAPSQLEELEEHAAVVAAMVLERPKSGRDLAEDAEAAATLWAKKLGELFNLSGDPERVQSALVRRRRNSLDASSVASSTEHGQWAGPTLKKKPSKKSRKLKRIHSAEAAVNFLKNLVKAGGDAGDATSVHSGKTGKSLHSAGSRVESAPTVKSGKSAAAKSTPSVKGDAGAPLEFGVTNYGVADKKEQEKQPPIVRPPAEPTKPKELDTEDEELAKILKETGLMEKEKAPDAKSTKSSKSSKSNKSNKSSGSKDKNKEEFVVKKPEDDKVDHLLYKPLPEKKPEEKKAEPAKATKAKKPKKPAPVKKVSPAKKPKKKLKAEAVKEEPKPPPEETSKAEEEKKVEEVAEDAESEDVKLSKTPAMEETAEEDEMDEEEEEEKAESPEFIIIHDIERENTEPVIEKTEAPVIPVQQRKEFSDSEEEEPEPLPPSVAQTDMTADSELMSVYTEDSTSQGLSGISRSQAKAAKRAAEAERRKQAVERKRREREEAKRKQQEEAERQEQLRRDFEEEKRRKEEEIRLKREREAEELERRRREEEERKRQAAITAEREKKRMEEYKRKMEEIARQKREEEERKREENLRKQKEEDERRKAEEAKLAAMAEEERLEYERKKREDELIAMRLAEEERLKRELLAKLAQEEAERFALELAKRQKEMERRLMFNKSLQSEANVLSHSQEMTRAFTWSYFELLEFLGLAMPDFLKQYQSYTDTGS